MFFGKINFGFIVIQAILCYVNANVKSSLTFVIDRTNSMGKVINSVKESAYKIVDAVHNSDSSEIDEFILTTFADLTMCSVRKRIKMANGNYRCPPNPKPIVTKDKAKLKEAIADIVLENGFDCVEHSMTGIEEGLTISRPNSYLYVFTDAAAKDFDIIDRVRNLGQKKAIQVNFLLTGMCEIMNEKGYSVYEDIAQATSGQIFHIERDDTNEIIDYIVESVRSKKTVLHREILKDRKYITFTVDEKITDVTISISSIARTGSTELERVTDSDGKEVETKEIVHTIRTGVYSFDAKPGEYTVYVDGEEDVLIVVSGTTLITFEYGFSFNQPTSLDDTSTIPIKGAKDEQYISIQVDSKNKDVEFYTAELRDVDGKKLAKFSPSKLISKGKMFYVTDVPVVLPNEKFKIAINGFTDKKESITRISKCTIEYERPADNPIKIQPFVTIIPESPIEVEFYKSLTLKCNVHAYPTPKVTWTDDTGAIVMPEPLIPVKTTYDYLSELKIQKVDKNLKLTCSAVNTEGKNQQSIEIKTKIFLKVLEYPQNTEVGFKKSAKIKCIIDASPPAKISWFKEPNDEISNDDNYLISPDSLTIKSMHSNLKGKYYVRASNVYKEEVLPYFTVTMTGGKAIATLIIHSLELHYSADPGKHKLFAFSKSYTQKFDKTLPVVTITPESPLHVELDAAVTVKCMVIAYPVPNIIWTDDLGAILTPSPLIHVKDPNEFMSELKIKKVERNLKLTCLASNDEGKSQKSIEVKAEKKEFFSVIEYPKDATVEIGESVAMKCIIHASPPAKVSWFKESDKIINDDNFIISPDGSILTIKKMDSKLIGEYHATASNDYKKENFPFSVTMIGKVPKIDKSVKEYKTREGSRVDLQCKVIEGKPKSTISWSWSKSLSLDFDEIRSTDSTFHIYNIEKQDSGIYRCKAFNKFGEDIHEMEVIVEYPPSVHMTRYKENFKEDTKVILNCTVDGSPKPKVQWSFDGAAIDKSSKYDIFENNSLSFIGTRSDAGKYTCTAINYINSASRQFILDIYVPITIQPADPAIHKLKVGDTVTLSCIASGYPKPSVSWKLKYYIPKTMSKKLRSDIDGSYKLNRAQSSDNGSYICEASNIGDSQKIKYEVLVLAVPEIKTAETYNINAIEGDNIIRIPCFAMGSPKPTITWESNDLNIKEDQKIYHVDDSGTLEIKDVPLSAQGSYKCVAENSEGRDESREYKVEVSSTVPYKLATITAKIELGSSLEILCNNEKKLKKERYKIRWYKERIFYKKGEMFLSEAKTSDSGIYTCRVDDLELNYSFSFSMKVIVGFMPKFTSDVVDTVIEFKEGEEAKLNCDAVGEPVPEAIWRLDFHRVKENSFIHNFTMTKHKIGKYKCEIQNEFGSIKRTFEIKSEACPIPAGDKEDLTPLILSSTRRWILKKAVSINSKISLICPGSLLTYDGEPFADNISSITATCLDKNMYEYKRKTYDITKMNCGKKIEATHRRRNKPCQRGNTELVEVGYYVKTEFLSVFDVCIDKDKYIIHFTKYGVHPGIADFNLKDANFEKSQTLRLEFDDMYDCEKQRTAMLSSVGDIYGRDDTCCFGKRQFVNARDVIPGLQQLATYTYLNVVPIWSSCGSENWDEVERRIRSLVKNINYQLQIWSGSSDSVELFGKEVRLNDRYDHHQRVPLYLWKVIENLQESASIAIVLINVPNISTAQASKLMKCRDVCHETKWMKNSEWHDVTKGFVYCCKIIDFERAFRYNNLFTFKGKLLV